MDFNDIVDSISIKPYYLDRDAGQAIYCSDCRLVLPLFPDKSFDLVLTDPPYGLNTKMQGGTWGINYTNSDMKKWDYLVDQTFINQIIFKAQNSIVWGGNYYCLSTARCWLIWYKRDAPPSISDCELAWTNLDKTTKLFDYPIASVNSERNGHPTLKPVALFSWCIYQAGNPQTILDPFLGSGTTAVCAKKLGRKCVGIEISEEYCAIAVKRLSQSVMQFNEPQNNNTEQKSLI